MTSEDRRALVVALPPLVRPDQPVPVHVLHEREWWPGAVVAWRGQRVSVEFTVGPGAKHLLWVPADHVRRDTASPHAP